MTLKTLILLCSILASTLFAKEQTENINLTVGQIHRLRIPSGYQVQVARKGIVDLVEGRDESWQIIGLKAGFVTVKVLSEEGLDRLLTISVVKSAKSDSEAAKSREWMQYCKFTSLLCDEEMGVVNGVEHDFAAFIRLKRLCQVSSDCLFLATLSDAGQASLNEHLKTRIGPSQDFEVKPTGAITIWIVCERESEESAKARFSKQISEDLFKVLGVTFQCSEKRVEFFQVKAQVNLVELGNNREQGFDRHLSLSSSPDFEINLSDRTKGAKVIAEPIFVVSTDKEAKVKTGGEFVIESEGTYGKTKVIFKEYGIDLLVKLRVVDSERLVCDFDFKIVRPEEAKRLNNNGLVSQALMELDRKQRVGVIELSSADDEENHTPFFAQIPFIGPLFRKTDNKKFNTEVHLFFEITKKFKEIAAKA